MGECGSAPRARGASDSGSPVATRAFTPSLNGMRSLSDSEVKAFLLEGTRTAKLSVVRKDGSPFVTPVWFLLEDDGSVVFETERRSLKGHALARDPRVSLCVEDDRPPFGFVRLDGVAEISEGPEVLAWTTRIAARYMG